MIVLMKSIKYLSRLKNVPLVPAGWMMVLAGGIVFFLALNLVGVPFILAAPDREALPITAPALNAKATGLAAKKLEFSYEVVTVLTSDDRGDKLRMPSGLIFDRHADELYLVNGGDSRLIVYGPDYFPQESLGTGRGLNSPVGGAVDDKGNLYITQAGNATTPPRLTILNPAFLPVKEIIFDGIPEIGSFSPHKIALGPGGRIYLVGNESKRVLALGADGAFSHWFTVAIDKHGDFRPGDQGAAQLSAVIKSVVVDALGNLYFLSEETSKVYVFAADERYLFSFGAKGGAEGKMSRPRALAIDERNKCIYVVDYMRHTVLIFDFTGTFRFEFGGLGWGPGWFNYPVDIVLGRQGQVVVADFFNQRAQVFAVTLPDFPERPAKLWQTGKDGTAGQDTSAIQK